MGDAKTYDPNVNALWVTPRFIVIAALSKHIRDAMGGFPTLNELLKVVDAYYDPQDPQYAENSALGRLLKQVIDDLKLAPPNYLNVNLRSGITLGSGLNKDRKALWQGQETTIPYSTGGLSDPERDVWRPLAFDINTYYTTVHLLGMRLMITMDKIELESFGFYERDAAYMQDTKMTSPRREKPTHTNRKAHAMQLLLDEMAIELLRLKQFLKQNTSLRNTVLLARPSVEIELQDAWTPKPELYIVRPFPQYFTKRYEQMDSEARWSHLTGTISYYTQFGFRPKEAGLGADFYKKCVQEYVSPRVVRKDMFDTVINKTLSECARRANRHGLLTGTMVKHFEPGKEITFEGAFSLPQNNVVYANPDQYYNEVVIKGIYPTVTKGIRDYSTQTLQESKKRQRTEMLGIPKTP